MCVGYKLKPKQKVSETCGSEKEQNEPMRMVAGGGPDEPLAWISARVVVVPDTEDEEDCDDEDCDNDGMDGTTNSLLLLLFLVLMKHGWRSKSSSSSSSVPSSSTYEGAATAGRRIAVLSLFDTMVWFREREREYTSTGAALDPHPHCRVPVERGGGRFRVGRLYGVARARASLTTELEWGEPDLSGTPESGTGSIRYWSRLCGIQSGPIQTPNYRYPEAVRPYYR